MDVDRDEVVLDEGRGHGEFAGFVGGEGDGLDVGGDEGLVGETVRVETWSNAHSDRRHWGIGVYLLGVITKD